MNKVEALKKYREQGTYVTAAYELGVDPTTVRRRIKSLLRSDQLLGLGLECLDELGNHPSIKALATSMDRDIKVVTKAIRHAKEMGFKPISSTVNLNEVEVNVKKSTSQLTMGSRPSDRLLEKTKQETEKLYLSLTKKLKRVPNTSDLEGKITRSTIRALFQSTDGLHEHMEEHFSDEIAKYTLTERILFTQKRMDSLNEDMAKFKRFFITTAVSEKNVDQNFYKAIKSYCEKNQACLLILMSQDAASRRRRHEWSLDPILEDEHVIVRDVKLNDNFFISSIKLSAKHINPLTGLNRIGQRNGSFIYASPKQFLSYVATSQSVDRIPHALMTTGAITEAEYGSDYFMSQRTSRIAEEDHVLGGVIVEVENDTEFHFRQVQFNPSSKSFIDLCVQYQANGRTKKVEADFVLGDYHAGATDPMVKEAIRDVTKCLPIRDLILHDFFDGFCINHHDRDKPGIASWKAEIGWMSIVDELKVGASEINDLHSMIPGNLIMVKSNHDEILDRYLAEGAYLRDRVNYYTALDLARKAIDGEDVLEYAYNTYSKINHPKRIKWLQRDAEYKVGGVELGAHGDLGSNGSRGSLQNIENAYGNCVVGHTHSAAIHRGVYRVGTSSKKNLSYNRGPSSWTHTSCLVYRDGSRQLINFINGKWRI